MPDYVVGQRHGLSGFRAKISELVDEDPNIVLDALTSAVQATKRYRRDMTCPKCKHKYRANIEVADDRTRLEAAKLLAEHGSGRPAVTPAESAGAGRFVLKRYVVDPLLGGVEQLVRRAALGEDVALEAAELVRLFDAGEAPDPPGGGRLADDIQMALEGRAND